MLIIIFIWILLVGNILGHSGCQTDEISRIQLKKNPGLKIRKKRNDDHWHHIEQQTGGHTAKWNLRHKNRRHLIIQDNNIDGNIDIPIIIHILYDSNNNIHDRVEDYSIFMDRLMNINLNFNEANSDISQYPAWQDILGNMEMSFFINKIVYVDVGNNSPFEWGGFKTIQSASEPIDERHSLNMWFARPNVNAGDSWPSGYSSFPWYTYGGIVMNINLINGEWIERFPNWGQYLTIFSHEIGHWVGLSHIWGDHDTPSCNEDDDVVDTPNMADKYGDECPEYNNVDDFTTCGQIDMFENFMSYADCINMFTDGQVARARSNFMIGGYREGFIDYKINPAANQFVNMIYFIGINDECMLGDTKKSINQQTEYALCVSYSRNPHIDVYDGIEITKDNQWSDKDPSNKNKDANYRCSNGYSKIDTYLNGYFVCYRKVAPQNPLSESTIIDLDIVDMKVELTRLSANTDPTDTDTELCQEILQLSGSVSGSSLFLNDLEWIKIIDENEDGGYYFISNTDEYYMRFVSECRDKNWWLIIDAEDSFNDGNMKSICDVAVGRCQRSQISECDERWAFRECDERCGHFTDTNVKILSMETKCE